MQLFKQSFTFKVSNQLPVFKNIRVVFRNDFRLSIQLRIILLQFHKKIEYEFNFLLNLHKSEMLATETA